LLRNANSGSGCDGGLSGSGRCTPLGRPVVPLEYSMAVPSHSSAMGVAGKGATASAKSTKRGSPDRSARGPPSSTTRQRSTLGQSRSAWRTMSSLVAEVISTLASQLLTM
jgi:hypothetical protein